VLENLRSTADEPGLLDPVDKLGQPASSEGEARRVQRFGVHGIDEGHQRFQTDRVCLKLPAPQPS
jgi:hypothetical protein